MANARDRRCVAFGIAEASEQGLERAARSRFIRRGLPPCPYGEIGFRCSETTAHGGWIIGRPRYALPVCAARVEELAGRRSDLHRLDALD